MRFSTCKLTDEDEAELRVIVDRPPLNKTPRVKALLKTVVTARRSCRHHQPCALSADFYEWPTDELFVGGAHLIDALTMLSGKAARDLVGDFATHMLAEIQRRTPRVPQEVTNG